MAVITQAEARVYLPGLNADDSTVATLISRADAILAEHCGYEGASEGTDPTFEDVTFTRYLPGPGGRKLQLPFWPVVSVTSIEDDSEENFDGSTYLVDSGDYSIRPRGIVLLTPDSKHGAWSKTDNTEPIKAVFVAGYTTPPESLKQIVAEYVGHLWRMRSGPGVSSVLGPNGSENLPDGGIPDSIRQRLRPYMLTAALGQIP